jgi:hypothetical protein
MLHRRDDDGAGDDGLLGWRQLADVGEQLVELRGERRG